MRNVRKEQIKNYIYENARASVAELCTMFSVSEATIRRDLDELGATNLIKRTFGGAIIPDSVKNEPPVIKRRDTEAYAKRLIAAETVKHVKEGETVFLGSGSTVFEVAVQLEKIQNITVISNSLPIIDLFSLSSDIEVIATGGYVRKSELSLIGHTVEYVLSELRSDKAILGIQGIHAEHGLTNLYLPETMTDRAIIRFSNNIIVVADHTKFGQLKPSFVADLSVVNTIVTDGETDTETIELIKAKGIEVIVAS